MSIAFIACVEPGNLENQGILLFRSIRKYGGRYRNASIYSFQPRQTPPLAQETLKIFDQLGVVHNTEILNTEYTYHPNANKILSSARAEEILDEDILVHIDSDTVIINEPCELELSGGIIATVRPVDRKRWGSSGVKDPNDTYWRKLYKICGAPETPFIYSTVDQQRIRAYWNGGLIAVRRTEGLFQRWREDFRILIETEHYPPNMSNIVQMALAATLARVFEKVKILDYHYNYPLPLRPLMLAPLRFAELKNLVHIHYHRWFNKPSFLTLLQPPLDRQSDEYQWIDSFLPFQPIIDESFYDFIALRRNSKFRFRSVLDSLKIW